MVFVLFSAMLCWTMFAPIYKHVLIIRQAVLQKETDLLLEIGANASHGYIDNRMIEASRERLAAKGFDPGELEYVVTTDNGEAATDPDRPVVRGTGIRLMLSYPYERLFEIDRLVGIKPPPEGSRIQAEGMKMSEYIPGM